MTAADAAEAPVVRRGAGRPRNPELEQRLKRVALETLAKHGFSGLTLEKICAGARVPRATFYRRWSTPTELVIEAFNERFEFGLLDETGDLRADLVAFADKLIALYSDPILGPCSSFIINEGKFKPEAMRPAVEAQRLRRRHNYAVLERGLATLGHPTGLSPRLVLSTLNGLASFTYSTGRKVTREEFAVLIDKLLAPIKA